MNETWKQIKGFEYYQISNLGKVKSCARTRIGNNTAGKNKQNGKKFPYSVPEKILKPIKTSVGYPAVNLYTKDLKIKSVHIHRLVAEAFIPNPENKQQVNHKNGIKTDYSLKNLEWVTASENVLHSYAVLGQKASHLGKFGKKHPTSKPVLQKTLSGKLIKRWESALTAVTLLGFDSGSITKTCQGKQKHHKGYIWEYVK